MKTVVVVVLFEFSAVLQSMHREIRRDKNKGGLWEMGLEDYSVFFRSLFSQKYKSSKLLKFAVSLNP